MDCCRRIAIGPLWSRGALRVRASWPRPCLAHTPKRSLHDSNNSNSTRGADGLEYISSCYFPTTFVEAPLLKKERYNHDSTVFTFGLPEGKSLQLPVCACLLLQGTDKEGNAAVRPYTPMSSNAMKGGFQLLIKIYEKGVVSQYVDQLTIGASAQFKHIAPNIKMQYPFAAQQLTLICGGTGITPMYQALHKLVNTPGDTTDIVLLYGSRTEADILLRAELDDMAAKAGDRLKIVHVLSGVEAGGAWDGETGYIDAAKIKAHAFVAGEGSVVCVCGVPVMYDTRAIPPASYIFPR